MEGDIKGFRKKVIVYQISIHALRVEGDQRYDQSTGSRCDISIHALRVEGDTGVQNPAGRARPISIHALRVEGDKFS